jgi:hypothetical protein
VIAENRRIIGVQLPDLASFAALEAQMGCCRSFRSVRPYIGRYTHRVAIANHRILDVRDGWVRFTYRNRRQGNRVQTMTLDADEFIRRFLLHVLPRGFMRLRHYGFLANRHKARTLRRCRELLGQPADPPPRSPKSVVQWM